MFEPQTKKSSNILIISRTYSELINQIFRKKTTTLL